MRAAGYNSPKRMTSYKRLPVWVLALACLASAQVTSRWDAPCVALATQIAALNGPGTITLSVTNRSSLPDNELPAIRKAIERNLRAAGVTVRQKDADANVRVTFSQNVQGWLWVAEVQEGAETKVAMLPVAGATQTDSAIGQPTFALRSTLLQAQAAPILDVLMAQQHMIVLEPDHIRLYTQATGAWQLLQSLDVPHPAAFPRDVRGRLVPGTDHVFDAYLPGVVCNATKPPDSWTLSLSCNASDDPWPLGSQKAFYNANRNFFTGVVVPGFGPKLPPFYAMTDLQRPTGSASVFMDLAGNAHVIESGSHKLLVGARDWGSDIAGVRSQCGSGMQVMASAAGWPVADSVRAYEISGREATPVSAAANFDGTITALWPAAEGSSAIAVVHKRDLYEAYSIAIDCGH